MLDSRYCIFNYYIYICSACPYKDVPIYIYKRDYYQTTIALSHEPSEQGVVASDIQLLFFC
jgi:hypothetical protein